MPSEGDSCPVCDQEIEYLYTIDRFHPPLKIGQCPDCMLQMQLDLHQDPNSFYSEDYYTGKQEFSYRDERKFIKYDRYVHNARLKTISKYKKAKRFLDIGCSFGGFVESAQRKGFDATGIDVSEYAVESGQKNGLDLIYGDLFSETLEEKIEEEGKFDVITMIEVIEHLQDPDRVFERLNEIMNPDGLLVIQTADFGGRQAQIEKKNYHYYLPGHLYYYSASNLTELLLQNRFKPIKIFRPVDFGLMAKLKKSRGSFKSLLDYFQWLRISWYHLKGKIHYRFYALTSSMVIYAKKR